MKNNTEGKYDMKDLVLFFALIGLMTLGAYLGNPSWNPVYPIGGVVGALAYKYLSRLF